MCIRDSIETDILNNFKRLGVAAETLDGKARLAQLHGIFHMDEQVPFRFEWDWLCLLYTSFHVDAREEVFTLRDGHRGGENAVLFRGLPAHGAVSYTHLPRGFCSACPR